MEDDDLYDSDLEELVQSGKEVNIIYFDSIEQLKQHEKEIDEITAINKNPNVVQCIIFKPTQQQARS